jgi:hypothetical protein
MKTMTGTIAVAAAAACAGTLALAGNNAHHASTGTHKWTPGQGWDHFVATFDANKDGKVTDEMLASAGLRSHGPTRTAS